MAKWRKKGADEAPEDVEMAASAPTPEQPMASGYDAYSGAVAPPATDTAPKKAAAKMQYSKPGGALCQWGLPQGSCNAGSSVAAAWQQRGLRMAAAMATWAGCQVKGARR